MSVKILLTDQERLILVKLCNAANLLIRKQHWHGQFIFPNLYPFLQMRARIEHKSLWIAMSPRYKTPSHVSFSQQRSKALNKKSAKDLQNTHPENQPYNTLEKPTQGLINVYLIKGFSHQTNPAPNPQTNEKTKPQS